MSFDAERIYGLLPSTYRLRDGEQGGPLRALLSVIAGQVAVLENDLAQLLDDQFVETCAPWVLPYIGDLLGIRGLPSVGADRINPRAEVAHTLGYRRRKGTSAMLQQLARDVTGWPARAVEFFQVLATTQHVNHVRRESRAFVEVRDADRLDFVNGPFEHLPGSIERRDLTHRVDVRHVASGRGRYDIPHVGIFVWRLRPYAWTRAPAAMVARDPRRFTFDPLGRDTPLFHLPRTQDRFAGLAAPANVPDPIRRRTLWSDRAGEYGSGLSLFVELPRFGVGGGPVDPRPLDAGEIVCCDLSSWDDPADQPDWADAPGLLAAIDPVLGRLRLRDAQPARSGEVVPPLVSFHYGFAMDVGGGQYDRIRSFDPTAGPVQRVANTPVPFVADPLHTQAPLATIQDALTALPVDGGVVEIADSGRYAEPLVLPRRRRLEIRAADRRKPVLQLAADLPITGLDGDEVTLNGLIIAGGTLRVPANAGANALRLLRLRHCTLVPTAGKASVSVSAANVVVEIDHCITGPVLADDVARVEIRDSIVDALDEKSTAFAATDGVGAGAPIAVERCTIIGRMHTAELTLLSNSIVMAAALDASSVAPLEAQRRQAGCARFSYLPAGARTPRRFHCQPRSDVDAARLQPVFGSRRLGHPAYGQLGSGTAAEIRAGADDQAEMGAFHDLYQPQREAHLKARLEESLRFGLEVGVFFVT